MFLLIPHQTQTQICVNLKKHEYVIGKMLAFEKINFIFMFAIIVKTNTPCAKDLDKINYIRFLL